MRFDNNKYSVASRAVGRPVEIQAYADLVVIRQDGAIVGEHPRCFGRGETIYNPWHYVPVLARKPGALRNGAPFKDWPLPASLGLVRRKLKGSADGDRQMVKILSAVLSDGPAAAEAARPEAPADGDGQHVGRRVVTGVGDPGESSCDLRRDEQAPERGAQGVRHRMVHLAQVAVGGSRIAPARGVLRRIQQRAAQPRGHGAVDAVLGRDLAITVNRVRGEVAPDPAGSTLG